MSSFEDRMEKACKDLEIPGAVLVASSSDGKFRYEKAFGVRSLKDPSKHDPLELDATMWLASCTKLMTTVAAMQCVERGLLQLDEDVTSILPELKGREILQGFEEGTEKPILVPNTKTITLRHLLTHQSGLSYDVFNPLIMKYQHLKGQPPNLGLPRSVAEAYDYPLIFAPGDAWEYGVGIDWAGLMVERVSALTLDAFLEKNVWGPLGMKNMSFHPKSNPSVIERLADLSERECGVNAFGLALDPGAKLAYTSKTVWAIDSVHCHGGVGGYGSVLEYQKILHSICASDGKILKPETVDEMFKPQLTDAARAHIQAILQIPEVNQSFGGFPPGTKVDWGIGGIMTLNEIPGRSAGSLAWGGYPNLLWWCDRAAGISGIYGSQIIPPGDLKTEELFAIWTEELYKRAGLKEKL